MSNKLKSSSAPPSTTPATNASKADILATTRKILSEGLKKKKKKLAYYTVKNKLLKRYSLYSFNRHKKSIQNEIEDFHKRMEVARPKRGNNKPPIRVEGETKSNKVSTEPIRVEGETKVERETLWNRIQERLVDQPERTEPPLPRPTFADLIRKKLNKEYTGKLKKSAVIHSEFDAFPGNEYMPEGRGFKMIKKGYSDGMNYSSDLSEDDKLTVSDWLKTLNLDNRIEIISVDGMLHGVDLEYFESDFKPWLLKLLETKMIDIDRRYMGFEILENVIDSDLGFNFSRDDIKKIKLALAKRKQQEEKSYDHDDNQAQQMLLNSFASRPYQSDTEGNASITNDMLGGRKRSRKHHRKRSRKSRRKSRRKKIKKTKKRRKKRTKKQKK